MKPFSDGLLEGYQTFGAIAAVVTGAVVIITINKKQALTYAEKKIFIIKASLVAASGLLLVFTGLILTGALLQSHFEQDVIRTELLSGISQITLGTYGRILLSILISLACFTTAVGVITGSADFIKGLFNESQTAYRGTAIVACLIGVIVGQLDVNAILTIAVPALLLVYPVTVIMIFLHSLPGKWVTDFVFRLVIFTALFFTIPDVFGSLNVGFLQPVQAFLPLGKFNLGWLLPAFLAWVIGNLIETKKRPI